MAGFSPQLFRPSNKSPLKTSEVYTFFWKSGADKLSIRCHIPAVLGSNAVNWVMGF
jgi:hypothetical protein